MKPDDLDKEILRHSNDPSKNIKALKEKGILLFDNRSIRHLERMIDLFHLLFNRKP